MGTGPYVIDKLAPTFESKPNQIQALKLVAYASTASWVAGVFNIIPVLSILGILGGLYSIYLFYLGLPVLMKSPPEKAMGYTVVVIICAIVIFASSGRANWCPPLVRRCSCSRLTGTSSNCSRGRWRTPTARLQRLASSLGYASWALTVSSPEEKAS